jgi:hypothetical protein
MRNTPTSLRAVLALAAVAGLGAASAAMPAPSKGSARDYKPQPAQRELNEIDRERAEWNARIERRKAEKKAKRAAR